MKNLGSVIQELREKLKLSREALAADICSGKYIYLIETGRRDPSARMIELLGNRLGEDLFEFLPYLDCQRPIFVKEMMEKMETLRHQRNFAALVEISKSLEGDPDFSKNHWRFERIYDELIGIVFLDQDYASAIAKVRQAILDLAGKMENKDGAIEISSPTLARLYNLMTLCQMNAGEFDEGFRYLEKVAFGLARVRNIKRFQEIYISIGLNYVYMLTQKKRLDEALAFGEDLLAFQIDSQNMGRLHMNYFLLSVANFSQGNEEEALRQVIKVLALGLSLEKQGDLRDICEYDYIKAFSDSGILTVNLYETFIRGGV